MEQYPPSVIIVLEMLLKPKQTDTLLKLGQIDAIVSWAWTCKKIFKICTEVCEAMLLTLGPNNTNLVLYEPHSQKRYLYKDSPTPLRWTVFSLLHCPVERKIQWLILLPHKFGVNTTLPCPRDRTLWLYNTTKDVPLSQIPDNEIHTVILCDPSNYIDLSYIHTFFPLLTKLKLIRAELNGRFFQPSIFLSNLVTLSIIECDLTYCNLNHWMLSMTKLENLKLENNKWDPKVNLWYSKIIDLNPSIKSVSITHTNPEALFINTRLCRSEVFIK
jgi:hypothetical protein